MFDYLTRVNDTCLIMDHRVLPEIRAMFAAMVSRMPLGGITKRYGDLVDEIAKQLFDVENAKRPYTNSQGVRFPKLAPWEDRGDSGRQHWRELTEDALTIYPVHPIVQAKLDKYVRDYGHSSVLELVGSPTVFIEGVSWWTNWVLFDSPLCAGQEFSTRAVRHKNWPMAGECLTRMSVLYQDCEVSYGTEFESDDIVVESEITFGAAGDPPPKQRLDVQIDSIVPISELKELHEAWFEVFEAELEWRANEYRRPCPECGEAREAFFEKAKANGYMAAEFPCDACGGTGKKYPTKDKEPFRPALDQSRWALPGTIATGCVHTTNLRERARVLAQGKFLSRIGCDVCGSEGFLPIANIPKSGEVSLDGFGECPFCERTPDAHSMSVWNDIQDAYVKALPGMAEMGMKEAVHRIEGRARHLIPEVRHFSQAFIDNAATALRCTTMSPWDLVKYPGRLREKTYLAPDLNRTRFLVSIPCSLAVARDWHRHRTAYPWRLTVAMGPDHNIHIHPAYTPHTLSSAQRALLLEETSETFKEFMAGGYWTSAMMSLPLGTFVLMECEIGLRDLVYMLELRSNAPGANFEYKKQAEELLHQLRDWAKAQPGRLDNLLLVR